MPLADVVESEANPLGTVRRQDLREHVVVADLLVLSDLEDHRRRRSSGAAQEQKQEQKSGPVDVSALSSMLASKWKGAGAGPSAPADTAPRSEQLKPGQIRSFRIIKLDGEKKKIDLELIN